MEQMAVTDVLERIQMDYLEMPGLKVTLPQGRRLWDLQPDLCARALEMLVAQGFLVRGENGTFLRPGIRSMSRVTPMGVS